MEITYRKQGGSWIIRMSQEANWIDLPVKEAIVLTQGLIDALKKIDEVENETPTDEED